MNYEQHLRYFDRMVELTHAFDTHIIRGFAFWSPNRGTGADRPDIAPYLDMIAEKLSPIVSIAEDANVTLALKNEGTTLVRTC